MKKYDDFFYNSLEKNSEDELEDDIDQEENNWSDNGLDNGLDNGSDEDNELNIKISKLKIQTKENPQQEYDNIFIEFSNDKNLEKIQDEYYNKIININKNIIVVFIIPQKLIKTRVFTFYKCWKNGYCLNASNTKIPKNITKIILKKI